MLRVKRATQIRRCDACRQRRAIVEVYVPRNDLALCGRCEMNMILQLRDLEEGTEFHAAMVAMYRRIGKPIPDWLRDSPAPTA